MKLTFNNISKCYGKKIALYNFQGSISDGIYGLLGPNGAGKTTLISILIGILQADSGNILLDGKDIKKMGAKYYDYIGYFPQYPIFYKNFSVYEFLNYMCILKNINGKKKKKRINEVIELVNLMDCYNKKISALSGGMRQRLGIAQSILNDPKILVLDEPTAGLDPRERIRFRNLISRLSKDRIVLLGTHIVSDVEYTAKEIIILDRGKLEVRGMTEDLINGISGKVWKVIIAKNEMDTIMEQYEVVNVKRIDNEYQLRILCEDRPLKNAVPIIPTLEDVFLSKVGNY